MTRVAAIFPGQGTQRVGMGRDVAEVYPAAADVFRQADEILGVPLARICFEGPEEELNRTDLQQPAVFVTSVALYRAAIAAGRLDEAAIAVMGGLSLGEYTALHLAGALSFEDALRLVFRRGQLMQQAAEQRRSGMVSLMGLDEAQALALCEAVAEHGYIRAANYNCPGQIVISGDLAACEAAVARVDEFGGKAVPLKVAGAFHSELMRPAAEALRPILAAASFSRPRISVLSNVDAIPHGDASAIRDALYRHIFNPVRWQGCVERMLADGVTEFYEVGPGRVLSGLLRKTTRAARGVNLSTADDLAPATAV